MTGEQSERATERHILTTEFWKDILVGTIVVSLAAAVLYTFAFVLAAVGRVGHDVGMYPDLPADAGFALYLMAGVVTLVVAALSVFGLFIGLALVSGIGEWARNILWGGSSE